MTYYRVDVQNPDDAERLADWLNRTRALSLDMPAEGDTVVTFDQSAFDWLAMQPATEPFHIATYGHFAQATGVSTLWIEDEDCFPVRKLTS